MLSDTAIRAVRAREKPYKIADGGGLYLLVTPADGRLWRLKFRIDGREKVLALGKYPDVPLKLARERRDAARRDLANGIDPSAKRRAEKTAASETFEAVGREYISKFLPRWKPGHADKLLRRLEMYIFPWIGSKPIAEIKAPDVLPCLRRIEALHHLETTKRTRQVCSRVFLYGVATGRCEGDPTIALKGAIPPAAEKHHASFTDPAKVGELLRSIDLYDGTFVVRYALKLAPLVFVRPGELRSAEWKEIDFEVAEWRIPAARMKMNVQHIVPLSNQAIALLKELKAVSGSGRFVFPGARSVTRPLSDNALTTALRAMGYERGTVTVHGFRSTASTLLNEKGWNRDAIERQLAHGERDAVRAAYNYADYLPERKKMMQAWSDYLDKLRSAVARLPIDKVR
jgi:integrase